MTKIEMISIQGQLHYLRIIFREIQQQITLKSI